MEIGETEEREKYEMRKLKGSSSQGLPTQLCPNNI